MGRDWYREVHDRLPRENMKHDMIFRFGPEVYPDNALRHEKIWRFKMNKLGFGLVLVLLELVASRLAETGITRAGANYSGTSRGAAGGTAGFTDSSANQCVRDRQSLVFSSAK
jgi:hypothetical protein